MIRIASVNGRLFSGDEGAVSPFDRGLTLGDGLFETVRVYAGAPFRLDSHLGRLRDGAQRMRIPYPDDLAHSTRAICEHTGGDGDLALRIILTRGHGEGDDSDPTCVVTLSDLPAFRAGLYESGIRVLLADGRRNQHAVTAGIKTLSYSDSIVALRRARDEGADDALFLDTEGHVSEGATSNVVAIFGEVAISPPVGCGAIPGITLATFRDLAPSLGITAEARALTLPELLTADEVLLTSSLREIVPVVEIDGKPIRGGSPGPAFRRFLRAYRDLARS